MSYAEDLNVRVMSELTEILLYCHTCEFQVLELLKVANCIFSKEEFFQTIDLYRSFKSNLEILEKLLKQVDVPITMLQIITVKSMICELKDNFDDLVEILEEADRRIDHDEIDFNAASMLNDLLDRIKFEVVDFDDFKEALSARYFVACLINNENSAGYPNYGNLKVLLIQSFKTKRAAFTYALKNGISKDMVWSRY